MMRVLTLIQHLIGGWILGWFFSIDYSFMGCMYEWLTKSSEDPHPAEEAFIGLFTHPWQPNSWLFIPVALGYGFAVHGLILKIKEGKF